MACKTSYELHHQFPKLADESGFTFNSHRPRVHIDWNKIKLIDIESLIRERKFVLIEQHINDILDCVLESEFDVRILDDGVLKMFRLAQLAVEYHQFCRHYLDRSVYVLRQEINSLAQELEATKLNLQDKEEELRKIRKRTRHTYKTPLPYGNDNIAAMILKTLNNKGDLFATTSRGDVDQYNKCKYCEKVFLNQLYLQSHISRRHSNQMDVPKKETNNETCVKHDNETSKLNSELLELRNKLEEMEVFIVNINKQDKSVVKKNMNNTGNDDNLNEVATKCMKDAEISTNNEEYLLNKIEEWKKDEHEKCKKEINILRDQITATINSFKLRESKSEDKDSSVLDQLRSTILEQGAEIEALKQELKQSGKCAEVRNSEKIKEAEKQISFWTSHAEAQSKQYESLLQKLNDVTKDAKESREFAESEKRRAKQLETLLLEYNRNNKVSDKNYTPIINNTTKISSQALKNDIADKSTANQLKKKQSPSKSIKITDRETLENLHRKAQELLDMGSVTSDLSDSSSVDKMKMTSMKNNQLVEVSSNEDEKQDKLQFSTKTHTANIHKLKERKIKNESPKIFMDGMLKEGEPGMDARSPIKVVRAKLTEEVNSRLLSLGVDPLKNRLSENVFQSQRIDLQKIQELKSKKNPSREKIKYSLLAYLDSNTSNRQDNVSSKNKCTTQDKMPKPFRNLTSMISGVKSKAISLVKLNGLNVKEKRNTFSADVAKRAMLLLKTPPGSAHSSPSHQNPSLSKSKRILGNDSHANSIKEYNPGAIVTKQKKNANSSNGAAKNGDINKSDSSESFESDQKFYKSSIVEQSTKGIDTLIKSPAYRPSATHSDYDHITIKHHIKENNDSLTRTQSAIDLSGAKVAIRVKTSEIDNYKSSDDVESLSEPDIKSDTNVSTKKTKSVLKNASSTSSLNKKKVIFDMDAIQMKSLSATPSQSNTEKSDNESYELGLVNLDTDEWDISSIENEPIKNDTKLQLTTRTSPKIAELKQTIEAQLARRTEASSGLVGGVDVMGMNKLITKDSNIGGSNTSLGSSILDESDSIQAVNKKAFVIPKKIYKKEGSELDISQFSIDGINKTNNNESF